VPRSDLEAAAAAAIEWSKRTTLGPVRAELRNHRGVSFLDFPMGGPQLRQPSVGEVCAAIDATPDLPPADVYVGISHARFEQATRE